MTFDAQKLSCLSQVDLSRKGSTDAPILSLIAAINGHADYFTTSSCSGRLMLIAKEPNQKKAADWLLNSHEPISAELLLEKLAEYQTKEEGGNSTLYLKFDPLILHIRCRDLESARKLHTLALDSGLRNSGLTVAKNITLAMRSTLSLEVPLGYNSQVLVHEDYLRFLAEETGKKFEKNHQLIQKLTDNMQKADY